MKKKNTLGTDTVHNEEEWYEGEWGKIAGSTIPFPDVSETTHKPRERKREAVEMFWDQGTV